MAEDFPSYDPFYTKPPDPNVSNVITRDPKRVGVTQVFDQRCIENERLTQKNVPTTGHLKHSYGSVYDSRQFLAENDPLITKTNYQRCQPYLCAEPIRLSKYRRTQIFLFFYIVFYVGYLIVGSICFQKLENGMEQIIRDEFREDRQKFLREYPDIKGYFYVCLFSISCAVVFFFIYYCLFVIIIRPS